MQQQQPTHDSSQTQLLELPHECLVAVLQRLRATIWRGSHSDSASVCSAARAHSRLHAAAVAALDSIRRQVTEEAQLDSLQRYLERHGQHVSSLDLWGAGVSLRRLPPACSQLRSLKIGCNLSVQLGANSSHPGVLQAAPQLSKLYVSGAVLDTAGDDALTAALAGLSGLRDLHVLGTPLASCAKVDTSALVQLTRLGLPTSRLDDAAGLKQLLQLQELELQVAVDYVLPAGAVAGLRQLTKLVLSEGSMEPAALQGIPQLQQLELIGVAIAGEDEGAAEFVAHLGQLQDLTYLDLVAVEPLALAPPAAFTALTASHVLQSLLVQERLPPGAWQHVFSASRQRPALQELGMSDCMRCPRDAEGMVAACPGLRQLSLYGLGEMPDAPPQQQISQLLAPLTALAQLTSLEVSDVDDPAAGAVLAQLSGLTNLEMHASPGLSASGLLALTQLRGLTSLQSPQGIFNTKARAGASADVWRQVLEHCQQQRDDPVVRQLACQAAATEAQLEQLRRRVGEQEQQHAALQQQVATLKRERDSEVAQLKQELAAQRAEHAAFQADVARQLAGLRQQR